MHVPPVQIARHVNDEQMLNEFARDGRYDGVEIDVEHVDRWVVSSGHGQPPGPPVEEFLQQVEAVAAEGRRSRLKTMMQVKGDRLGHDEADALLDRCDRLRNRLDIRFVGFSPEVMNTFYHAAMSRDDPYACQVYMQEDDVTGHVQWSKRRRLGLPEDIGYHLRLHAFPPSVRPSYEEVESTGRRITTTGWNPLYRGWRNRDLSDIWNLRRL